MNVSIIYEDNHIIVAEKPAGVLSQAGSLDLPDVLTEIKAYLKEKYQKPGNVFLGLIHRLDTNVGGVMVFAKTSKAASRLSDQVRKHEFEKKYLAVVKGIIERDKQVELTDYLIKDEENKKAIISQGSHGKKSILSFNAIATKKVAGENWTLIDIELKTGRFHQIRAQLANINHPIYNDSKYGDQANGYELGLYSYEISFIHPTLKSEEKFKFYPSTGIFSEFTDEISRWRNQENAFPDQR